MGLFSRGKADAERELCPHDFIDPRWESMSDVGREECIDHFICRRCGEKIAPDRVRATTTDG